MAVALTVLVAAEDYLVSPDYGVIEASEAALAGERSGVWTALN